VPATCLLVVDVQNDFMPGGALAVPGGDEVVPVINRLIARFDNVVLTQDWHPRRHISFASSPMARRCSGLTTACRVPRVLYFTQTWT
jgi:nicotinamidase/pyrazinamidase